nr:hypothetical protein [Allomuricauda sp.]
MKKLNFFLVLIWLCSCAGENRNMENKMEFPEAAATTAEEMELDQISLDQLAVQKLNSFVELIKVRRQYPDFGNVVETQAGNLPLEILRQLDSTVGLDKLKIQASQEIIQVSDTTERVKIYLINTQNTLQKDSIYADITRSSLLIDGTTNISTSVTFSKSSE